jgi:hypothetical protein
MLKFIRPILQPFLRSDLKGFKSALQTPRASQQQLLKKIIAGLAETEYGRTLKIKAGDDYESFATKIPIQDFDGLSEWIARQQQTESRVLVAEPVLFYEKTSGSSAAEKLIPYTQSLKDSFNRMFRIWLGDLLEHLPELKTGKTFISISPAFNQNQMTAHSKPIGLADDAEYLNTWARVLLNPFLVLPPSIKGLQNPANFKHALALALLAEEHLEIISIWNPSLFEIILDYIQQNIEPLILDLQRGAIRIETIEFKFKNVSHERLMMLKEKPIAWPRLWSKLKLISCWTSAHAKPAAERLAAKFPDAFLQGKGLLATEAPMTLPLIAARGFVPMLTEVFFEFLDDQQNIRLLEELEVGREYEIILTQQGGLYRYRIGDRVHVTGFYETTPCLEFIGRTQDVCDLVGEKLNERFVQTALARLSEQSEFQMLLPVMQEKPHYLLIVEQSTAEAATLETELENLLSEAYHYNNARRLGQLCRARVLFATNTRSVYFDHFLSKGMKLGDIKHKFLITNLADAEGLLRRTQSQ